MIIHGRGSFWSNVFFGEHALSWLVPTTVQLDTDAKTLVIRRRNYYLIGVDRTLIPIRNVRRVEIDTHLFGADIKMKVYGTGNVVAKCIKKRDARKFYDYCLSEMSGLKGSPI